MHTKQARRGRENTRTGHGYMVHGTWGGERAKMCLLISPGRHTSNSPDRRKKKGNFLNVFEFLPDVPRRKMGKSWSVIKVIKMPFPTTISRTN